MRLAVFKLAALAVLVLSGFDVSHLFSETGGLQDHPVSVALVCEPSSKADKVRYYKSTSLFFKRLKAKRIQENGTAFFVGYGAFASETPNEQLALAAKNGYDLYLFSKETKENLPDANDLGQIPWISFVIEKKVEAPKKQRKSSSKNSSKKNSKSSQSQKKKNSSVKTQSKTLKSQKNSKVQESKSKDKTSKEEGVKTISLGRPTWELSFDSLKFWFSTITDPQEIPFSADRISFLAGEKSAEEWASLLEEKMENSTWIRLLSQPQDLRFNEGIYYTGCASPSIPNGISVLNFFFRGNRLIRLKQESFSLNSDGSGKSWDLE